MVRDREAILANRWLRPFAHLFAHPTLWHLNRRSVPRALAIGCFTAFMIPLGQFAFAALAAVMMRANVPLAAAATLITNPFTFPPIYFAAYNVGFVLLPASSDDEVGHAAGGVVSTLLAISGPTALGLLIFAVVSAVLGHAAGAVWWRIRLSRRWRRRGARPRRFS